MSDEQVRGQLRTNRGRRAAPSKHATMSKEIRVSTITVKSRGTVTVDVETCKGCELCIPACPPGVLTMSEAVNRMGYHWPELHPGCTGCAACLLVCPDFVFEVFRYAEPVLHEFEEPKS
jgi:2-oxoglutarate ferredoxin oxidoreductase subunit delta